MGGNGSSSMSAGGGASAQLAAYGLKEWSAWQSVPIDQNDLGWVIDDWAGSSSDVRHAINGRARSDMDPVLAEQFDDWLNGGSYNQTIYRGKRLTPEQLAAIEVGDIVNQDGPASFTKSMSVAQSFGSGGYNFDHNANQRTIFVLNGGTKAGRDITQMGGLGGEHEVTVGSSSHMRVTSIHTDIIDGHHYTFVEGTEIKAQYVSPHKKK